MRHQILLAPLLLAAVLPDRARAQAQAFTIAPRVGYEIQGEIYSQSYRGETGGEGVAKLRVEGHLEVALTAAYRLAGSPLSLFADAGAGHTDAVQSVDQVEACPTICPQRVHVLNVGSGPIALWHTAAGFSLTAGDRRGGGSTLNLMLGGALTGAQFTRDVDAGGRGRQRFRGGGVLVGADVTVPFTCRVHFRGGVSDLATRANGPDPQPAPNLGITNPIVVARRYSHRVRLMAGLNIGM